MKKPLKAPKRLYIIAGETSGDLHAAHAIAELQKLKPDLQIRGMGGDALQKHGMEMVQHIKNASFMGFVEVLINLPTILRLFRIIKKDIREYKPDAILLVDYPGFNLRIAKFACKLDIPVLYYIAPQAWAWNAGRAKKMREIIDLLLVILPFEPAFFAPYGIDARFVGHPLLDELPTIDSPIANHVLSLKDKRPLVALLPGSRLQEIKCMLPVMLEVASRCPQYKFVLALSSNLQKSDLGEEASNSKYIEIIQHVTHDLLRTADFALVTSGTATLETALLGTPQIVLYKGSTISYAIAKRVIRVRYISLVNLILDREAVPERIQKEMNADQIVADLNQMLSEPDKLAKMQADYLELKERLGNSGASLKAARLIEDGLNLKERSDDHPVEHPQN